MTLSALTDKPATLRQWLRRSLLWTMLGSVVEPIAWYGCASAFRVSGGNIHRAALILVHTVVIVILSRQATMFVGLDAKRTESSLGLITLLARVWWVLLLQLKYAWILTGIGLLLDWFIVLLFG